jgi:hypothetical protein
VKRFKITYGLFIISIILLALVSCSSEAVDREVVPNAHVVTDSTYDIFLVAGQSNTYYGLGYDSILDKPRTGIYQLGRADSCNMKIIDAKEPLQHYFPKPNRIGFALTFAKLYDAYCGYKRNILIIPCGMNSTGFIDNSWKRGDCLNNDAVERVNFVLKKYPKSKLKAILWCQGERDIDNPNFQTSLDSMIVGYRKDIKDAAGTPFIAGGMVPYWVEKNKKNIALQNIIKDTPLRVPRVGYADPYLPFELSEESDHYTATEQREMGLRFFEEYKKLVQKNK